MTAPGQLALDVPDTTADPLADLDLAHAAHVERLLDRLAVAAAKPRPCRCPRPLPMPDDQGEERCLRCGRFVPLPGPPRPGSRGGPAGRAHANRARGRRR